MRIHLLGAAGVGKTTLGRVLANTLAIPYFDSDDYYWEKSEIPFTVKREPKLRNAMIMKDINQHNNWVIGGSMINWGIAWEEMFSLVVFLYIPKHIRIERLRNRELERYGDSLYTDPNNAILYKEFMEWAAGYDDNSVPGRTLFTHKNWMKQLKCEVLEINGDITIPECLEKIIRALNIN